MMSFKIISERLTTRFFSALFSCSLSRTANSMGFQSFGCGGHRVGAFRTEVLGMGGRGTSFTRDQAGGQILSVADLAGSPCGDAHILLFRRPDSQVRIALFQNSMTKRPPQRRAAPAAAQTDWR